MFLTAGGEGLGYFAWQTKKLALLTLSSAGLYT